MKWWNKLWKFWGQWFHKMEKCFSSCNTLKLSITSNNFEIVFLSGEFFAYTCFKLLQLCWSLSLSLSRLSTFLWSIHLRARMTVLLILQKGWIHFLLFYIFISNNCKYFGISCSWKFLWCACFTVDLNFFCNQQYFLLLKF
jgi:hypothetical protein